MILNFMGYHEIVRIFEWILAGGFVIIFLSQIIWLLFGLVKDRLEIIEEIKEGAGEFLGYLLLIIILAGCIILGAWVG